MQKAVGCHAAVLCRPSNLSRQAISFDLVVKVKPLTGLSAVPSEDLKAHARTIAAQSNAAKGNNGSSGRRLWHTRAGKEFHQGSIRTADCTVDRDVFAKVTVSHRSARLRLGL
jgi:hypothetical protein